MSFVLRSHSEVSFFFQLPPFGGSIYGIIYTLYGSIYIPHFLYVYAIYTDSSLDLALCTKISLNITMYNISTISVISISTTRIIALVSHRICSNVSLQFTNNTTLFLFWHKTYSTFSFPAV